MTLSSLPASTNPENLPGRYHSFLVRLWQSHPQAPPHASAQCVQTGAIVRFADLDTLCAFLQAQMVAAPPIERASLDMPSCASGTGSHPELYHRTDQFD